MTTMIKAENLSLAWLAALEHLMSYDGREANLIVAVQETDGENYQIRSTLDCFLSHSRRRGVQSVTTVANTIFPHAFYQPRLKEEARAHLYECFDRAYPTIRRHPANRRGTYFRRLTAWPTEGNDTNQLEWVVNRLRQQLISRSTKSSIYELGISGIEDNVCRADDESAFDLHIHRPGHDTSVFGFPCLSHISLTLLHGKLHMTATYRNQHFIRKAYGNLLGLSRLLSFLCREAGCDPGELVCVATHADAEIGTFGKRSIANLIAECHVAVPLSTIRTPSLAV